MHRLRSKFSHRADRVLTQPALAVRASYLVFLDGYIVPLAHFVGALARAARPRWFVAGCTIRLSREPTGRVLRVNGLDADFVCRGKEDADIALRLRHPGATVRARRAGREGAAPSASPRLAADRPTVAVLEKAEREDRVEAVVGLRDLRAGPASSA